MDSTYQWSNEEQTILKQDLGGGSVLYIPAIPGNLVYDEFLASGATAAAYVAPPEPAPLTTEEKIVNAGFVLGELEEYLVGKIQQRLND